MTTVPPTVESSARATSSETAETLCLFEHAGAGLVVLLALCGGMAMFVAAALSSLALGALVGVLMIGTAGVVAVTVPTDRTGSGRGARR
ncbi:hypothetical protein [Rhodococcoides corynebacterioides]|uniref:Uncharacterized protein n=1 Tax=Rhodococcoides corynebacterioides TaxID=53972 RepID=A0ABS7P425_9NOCA|nr:hypothetical protein [Rhodococcus corynebacterioides]MBY6367173.1 hypothetical protein [Rhodococcus corynebacterioides]MBY6407413.1 hypothetical protein [Rhodococcus corynebacterioides]